MHKSYVATGDMQASIKQACQDFDRVHQGLPAAIILNPSQANTGRQAVRALNLSVQVRALKGCPTNTLWLEIATVLQDGISLSQAIEDYLLYADARRLSPHTVADYRQTFARFTAFIADDPPFSEIRVEDLSRFLASLGHLSKKTVLNYHTGLAALWTWAVNEGLTDDHIPHHIKPPKPEVRAIQPFSRDDIKALLGVCSYSKDYSRSGSPGMHNRRPTARRDKAMIMVLLDTGVRASELCGLTMGDCDLKARHILVMGKGSKERIIPISARTAHVLLQYLAQRKPRRKSDPLFATTRGAPITRNGLRLLLGRFGERAGVADCHPHRFRHTFAVEFLRNRGNPYILPSLLGHTTMEMTHRYLKLAREDATASHNRASPVDNWRL